MLCLWRPPDRAGGEHASSKQKQHLELFFSVCCILKAYTRTQPFHLMVLLPEKKMKFFFPFCFTHVGRTRNEESPALSGSALALTLKSALHQIKTHFEVLQRWRNLCPFFYFKERKFSGGLQSLDTLTFFSSGSDWSCIGPPVCVPQAEVYVWFSASA